MGGIFEARCMAGSVLWSGVEDHCVCVDADRKLIMDYCESYPVQLNMETLRLYSRVCANAIPNVTHVGQVYEIKGA